MKKQTITKLLSAICMVLLATTGFAQTFNGTGLPAGIGSTDGGATTPAGLVTTSTATVDLGAAAACPDGSVLDVIGEDLMIESVAFDATHTWAGDIVATIISPSGATLRMSSAFGDGGNDDNLEAGTCTFTFTDAGPDDYGDWTDEADAASPCNGGVSFPDENTFAAAFAGENATGDWVLSITDDAGGDFGELQTFAITFAAGPAPGACAGVEVCEIVCPSTINVNLDPGACEAIVDYEVTASGPCEITVGEIVTNGFTGAFDIPAALLVFNDGDNTAGNPNEELQNADCISFVGTTSLSMQSADLFFGDNACTSFGTVVEFVVPNDGVIEFDYTSSSNDTGNFDEFGYSLSLDGPNNVLSLGYLQGATTVLGDNDGGAGSSGPIAVTAGDLFSFVVYTTDGDFGALTATFSNFTFTEPGAVLPAEPALVAGLASGEAFPIGTTTIDYELVTDDGTLTCSFDVIVNEAAEGGAIACNDNVQVSLDENCEAIIGADVLLEGNAYGCYEDFTVAIEGVAGDVVTVAGVYTVTVTNEAGNSCWGTITVEDKIAPIIECDCPVLATEPIPVTFTVGELTEASPTFDGLAVDNQCWGGFTDTDQQYQVYEFSVDADDTYTFEGDSGLDLIGGIFEGSFDPANPCDNNIAFDDDGGVGLDPLVITALMSPGTYVLVIANTSFGSDLGAYTVNFSSDAGGQVLGLPSRDAECIFTCTDLGGVMDGSLTNAAVVTDGCGATTVTTTDVQDNGCEGTIVTRTTTATDAAGNEASCVQEYFLSPIDVDAITFPENRDDLEGSSLACTDLDDDNIDDTVDGNVLLDDNGHPHSDVTGSPALAGAALPDGGACGMVSTYSDQVIDICQGSYKILRTWTVVSWCTGNTATDIQIIKVLDAVGPAITCPGDMVVSTDFDNCIGNVLLPAPSISDACSSNNNYTTTVSAGDLVGNALYNLPLGETTVTYTATDDCGNESSCSFTVTVEDQVAPVAACDEHTIVTLSNTPEPAGLITIVDASVFDDGSYDNCSDVTFSVRRMTSCINFNWTTNGAGIDSEPNTQLNANDRGTTFKPAVPFACCDVGQTIMVELRVTDAAGNINSCMVEVEVQDKLNPLIQCPENKDLECGDHFDVVSTTTTLTDAEAADLGVVATDNCDVTLTYRDTDNRDNCGVGQVRRRFTATDNGGRTASCTQIFTFTNNDPFYINPNNDFDTQDDVVWPRDLDLNGCGLGLEPEDLMMNGATAFIRANAKPIVTEDACDQVAVTKQDILLPVIDDACLKILRTWIIIDWCQYNQDTGEGRWEYTQLIKVLNSDAPTITSACDDVEFCSYDADCENGPATLILTATDDCTPDDQLNISYKIFADLDNNGTQETTIGPLPGADASNTYPIGTHRVKFTVEDGCGNISTCAYDFEIRDCKAPTPYAYNGLAIELMPNSGDVELWASDFDAGSFDNCGIQEFRIATPSGGPGQTTPPGPDATGINFDCDQRGTNTVDLWVLDVNGNWDYVSTYVIVQDNNLVCDPDSTPASIAGDIMTTDDSPEMVSDVTVNVSGSAPGIPDPAVTGVDGSFAIPGLVVGGNYTVTPERDNDASVGISAYDAYLVQRHILGIQPFTSPYQYVAADVNRTDDVTGIDLVTIRKMVLHIINEWPNNTSWRFVDRDFSFPANVDPLSVSFPEIVSFNNLQAEDNISDFYAAKIGDLNNSAPANSLSSTTRTVDGALTLTVDNATIKAGQDYTVDFKAADFNNIIGYQFTLGFDKNALEVKEVANGALEAVSADNFGMHLLDEGYITTMWANTNAVVKSADEVLFSITFTAKTDVELKEALTVNSRYTAAEAYNADNDLLDVNMNFNGIAAGEGFALYQNTPNPFTEKTVISFNLPEAGSATVKIFDVSGKVLRMIDGEYTQGYNEVTISKSELSGAGVLYYQLETATESATKKMIMLK